MKALLESKLQKAVWKQLQNSKMLTESCYYPVLLLRSYNHKYGTQVNVVIALPMSAKSRPYRLKGQTLIKQNHWDRVYTEIHSCKNLLCKQLDIEIKLPQIKL